MNECGRIVVQTTIGWTRVTHWLARCSTALQDDGSCPAADRHVSVLLPGRPLPAEFYDQIPMSAYRRPRGRRTFASRYGRYVE